jgi:hypothetical protein
MKKFNVIIFMVLTAIYACNALENDTETVSQYQVDSQHEEYTKTFYENERFKEVRVEEISENTYRVSGKAQVYEANINYVVEDGHYELAEGFASADAGAPEFGNFDFTFSVEKKEPYTTLMLILFESSANDGSRTHELIIPLEE